MLLLVTTHIHCYLVHSYFHLDFLHYFFRMQVILLLHKCKLVFAVEINKDYYFSAAKVMSQIKILCIL